MNRRFYLGRASWSAETPLYQVMSAVRDSKEWSVSCEWARRRNYAGNYRSCFDHLLVAWAFRISCIHRVISHIARRRPRSPGLPFFVWEKGQHITAGTTLETRSEVARVRCRTISSLSLGCGTISNRARGRNNEREVGRYEHKGPARLSGVGRLETIIKPFGGSLRSVRN